MKIRVYDFDWMDMDDCTCVDDDGADILASEAQDQGVKATPIECQVWQVTIPEDEQLDPSRLFDYRLRFDELGEEVDGYDHEPVDWTTLDHVPEDALVWTKDGLHTHRTESDTLKRIGHI